MGWFSLWTLLQSVQLAVGSTLLVGMRSVSPMGKWSGWCQDWVMRCLLFPTCFHVGHRNCFKNQAEYKKFETQVFTKIFSCICNFYWNVYCCVFQSQQFNCLSHAMVLSVCDWKWLKTTLYIGTKLPHLEICKWSWMGGQLLIRQGSWQLQLLRPLYQSACGYPALSCRLNLSWLQYI